jgi:hypothetical protein
MYGHPIDDLYLSISLMMEGSGFGEIFSQQRP